MVYSWYHPNHSDTKGLFLKDAGIEPGTSLMNEFTWRSILKMVLKMPCQGNPDSMPPDFSTT